MNTVAIDSLESDQIDERKRVIRRALDLESNNPVPFLVAPYGMWYATQDVLTDVAQDLTAQEARNEHQSMVDDYSLPHLKPGTGLGTIATAFGCGWRGDPNADPWIEPLISDNPQDVYRLELPDPESSGLNQLFFDRVAYFQAHSSYPLIACNIPAPLTTASMIWDYTAFLTALIDHPRQVHHLLDLVTEYTILFLRKQIGAIQNLLSLTHMNWYIPVEYGLRVSDDVLAVVSPGQYREFGVPYNSRLSDEFGGLIVHSCGNIVHNIPTVLQISGIRGITLTLPHNDMHKIADLAAGKTSLMMRYWNPDWEQGTRPGDLVVYTKHVLEAVGTRGVMLEMQAPSATTEEAIELASRIQAQQWRSR